MEDLKDNFVDALIRAVKAETILYDKKHPDYFSKKARTKTFDLIGKKLGRDSIECEKRWKLIREKFSRTHKEVQSAIVLDSRAIEEVKWPYYFQMSFLKRHITKRRPRNSSSKNEENFNEQSKRIIRKRRAHNLSPEPLLSDPIDDTEKRIRIIKQDIPSDSNEDDSEVEGEAGDEDELEDVLSEVAFPTVSKKTDLSVLYDELKNAISAFNKSLNADDDDENFVRHVCSMMRPIPMREKDKLRGVIYEMVLNARKDLHK